MPQIDDIRDRDRRGQSVAQIARETGHDRKTVAKYLDERDFSPTPPRKTSRPSKLDPHKEWIDEILIADQKVWRKQRHTARRIYDRLVEEREFDGGITIVQNYIAERKRELAADRGCFLDLEWQPGTAQADFGDVDVIYRGEKRRMHMFSLSFPHSNAGFCQLFKSQCAECICQALMNIFLFLSAVPALIVFDNATGAGRRIARIVTESELFSRLRMHFRFEARFCNPHAGHEKGNVERKVGYHRHNLFVPVPCISSLADYNAELLRRSAARNEGEHYRKDETIEELFSEDVAAMLSLPRQEFSCVRYIECVCDKYGEATIEASHTYDVGPDWAARRVLCALGAYDVEFFDPESAESIVVYEREFGSAKTHAKDPLAQLSQLVRKPGAWQQSFVRESLPDALKNRLDALGPDELKSQLSVLSRAAASVGFHDAAAAASSIAEGGRIPSSADVIVMAHRMQGGLVPDIAGVDLSVYDRALLPEKKGA